MGVIWKLHTQGIRKWFTRGVSTPVSFFNVTWHQRPRYGKQWMWIWLVCWQHPGTHQKITQTYPSETEHLVAADRALMVVLSTLHAPRCQVNNPHWHLGMGIELRALTVSAETWDEAPSQEKVWRFRPSTMQPILTCWEPESPLPSCWPQVAETSGVSSSQLPASWPSSAGSSAGLPDTSCCATWHPQTLPGFQSKVKIFEGSEIWSSPSMTERWKGDLAEDHLCVKPLCDPALSLTAHCAGHLLLALYIVLGCDQPNNLRWLPPTFLSVTGQLHNGKLTRGRASWACYLCSHRGPLAQVSCTWFNALLSPTWNS